MSNSYRDTTDVLTHLPNSGLFSCFLFLLKKLRFLHDVHLLKFMMQKNAFTIKTERERETKTRNAEQEDKVAVAAAEAVGDWERRREKERGSREVWELSSSVVGGEWVYLGCWVSLSNVTPLNRRVRKVSDKGLLN